MGVYIYVYVILGKKSLAIHNATYRNNNHEVKLLQA